MAAPEIVSISSTGTYTTDALVSFPFPADAAEGDTILLFVWGNLVPDPLLWKGEALTYPSETASDVGIYSAAAGDVIAENLEAVNGTEEEVFIAAACVRAPIVEFPPRNASTAEAATTTSATYTESGEEFTALFVAIFANAGTDFPLCSIDPTTTSFIEELTATSTGKFAALMSAEYSSPDFIDTLTAGSTDATFAALAWIALEPEPFIPLFPLVRVFNGIEWVPAPAP